MDLLSSITLLNILVCAFICLYLTWTTLHMLLQWNVQALIFPFFLFSNSALLVTYHTLSKKKANRGYVSWWRFYLSRYLRLTPVYMFCILMFVSLSPMLGRGYVKNNFYDGEAQKCRAYIWSNLLYINNYVPHPVVLSEVCAQLAMHTSSYCALWGMCPICCTSIIIYLILLCFLRYSMCPTCWSLKIIYLIPWCPQRYVSNLLFIKNYVPCPIVLSEVCFISQVQVWRESWKILDEFRYE